MHLDRLPSLPRVVRCAAGFLPRAFASRQLTRGLRPAVVLLLLVATRPLPAQPAGELHPAIPCDGAPDQSYALYLPSGYTSDRSWPILYCFDPSAHGAVPVERLREAAERFGYILAGSNNSRNGSSETSETAARAMVRDTHRRFAINDQRIYGVGFSGGARVACALAGPWHFAGVLAAGAGFPEGAVPAQVPFAFYGCVGHTDMNYSEMKRTDAALAQLQVPHRLTTFDGGHEWIPSTLTLDALSWLELQAMRSGRRPRDDALIAALFDERMTSVRALTRDAERCLGSAAIAADFAGLVDVAEAAATAARLQNSEAMRKYLKAETKAAQQEERWSRRLAEAAVTPPREAASSPFSDTDRSGREDPFQAHRDGQTGAFTRPSESGSDAWPRPTRSTPVARGPLDPHEVLREVAGDIQREARRNVAARRALNGFAGALAEQASASEQSGDLATAIHALELGIIACPEIGVYHFRLARACARAGEKRKGRAALQEARAHGYADAHQLEEMEVLLRR